MKYLLLFLVGGVLFSCATRLHPAQETVNVYTYVFLYNTEAYERPDYQARRLRLFMDGDTITTETEIKTISGWKSVERNNYLIYVNTPKVRYVGVKTLRRIKGNKPAYSAIASYPSYTPTSSAANKTGVSEGSGRYSTPTTGATIHTGPRGGRYYINGNGNKTYIRKH